MLQTQRIMVPKTPPQNYTESFSICTPPTPRYAPIDEPDRQIYKKKASQVNPVDPVPAQHLQSLTPAETPANRKRGIDAISGGSVTTGRVLFPTATPRIGSGRTHKHSYSHSHSQPQHSKSLHQSSTATATTTSSEPSSSTTTVHKKGRRNSKNVRIISPSELQSRPSEPKITVFSDSKALKQELNNEDPFACMEDPFESQPINKKRKLEASEESSEEVSTQQHPHLPLPDKRPGMWHVFRGKKIYRPFKDGEQFDIKPKRLFQKEIEEQEKQNQQQQQNSSNDDGSTVKVDSEEEDTDLDEDPTPPTTPWIFRNIKMPRMKFSYR